MTKVKKSKPAVLVVRPDPRRLRRFTFDLREDERWDVVRERSENAERFVCDDIDEAFDVVLAAYDVKGQPRALYSSRRTLCPVHDLQRHGEEADELRRGVQEIVAAMNGSSDNTIRAFRSRLVKLLDDVDARDSLGFKERSSGAKKA